MPSANSRLIPPKKLLDDLKASLPTDVHEWLTEARKELGLDKIIKGWYNIDVKQADEHKICRDIVQEYFKLPLVDRGRLDSEDLLLYHGAISNWICYLKDRLGEFRAAYKMTSSDFDLQVNKAMHDTRGGGSIEERRSNVIWGDEDLQNENIRITKLQALIDQIDSSLWGLDPVLKSIELLFKKKNDQLFQRE
jgi:hypothetical protein